jgi:transposase
MGLGLERSTGTIDPKPQGGDTRSHHIEVFADVILAAIEAQKDVSLVELAELLRTGHGVSFAASTVWRFLDRHAMTFKKNSTRQRAGTARRRRAATSLVRRPA